jgi:DNA-binding transcriptional MerR regulator
MAVAARLSGMHPQTLRKYERAGLLRPARSGNQRFYSDADIRRLSQIRYLVEERGLNVAGLDMTLSMTDRLDQVTPHSTADEMRTAVADTLRITTEASSDPPLKVDR